MKINKLLILLFMLISFALVTLSQSPQKATSKNTSDNSEKLVLQNNAVSLIREIGKNSSNLTNVNQKIEIELESSVILWKYDLNTSLELLDKAWQDTFSEENTNEQYTNSQRNKILAFATKIAPEKAEKWRKEITRNKTEEEKLDDKSKIFTERQKADTILQTAIANLNKNPENAVSIAISTLNQTGKISNGFNPLIEKLAALKRPDLLTTVYKGITDFTKDRTSFDNKDLSAVINLMFDNSANAENRNKLLAFLLNSGKQIVFTQTLTDNSPKLSADEIFVIYRDLALMLKPFMQRYMTDSVVSLDDLLKELSIYIPADKLADPLLNPNSIEKQIEDAIKTVGSKERDARLIKIASWLISRRNRNENNYLKLAGEIADQISDIKSRDKLRDFIKLIEVEEFAADKNYFEAEKKVRSITSKEIKSWTLMSLGSVQENNPSISLEFYDDSFNALQKSNASNYKTQLSLILASLFVDTNDGKALEMLTQTAKFSNQVKDEENEERKDRLIFFSSIGDMNFVDTDLDIKANEIFIPQELGKLAIKNWYAVTSLNQQVQPLYLRLNLQMLMAKSVLEYTSKIESK